MKFVYEQTQTQNKAKIETKTHKQTNINRFKCVRGGGEGMIPMDPPLEYTLINIYFEQEMRYLCMK